VETVDNGEAALVRVRAVHPDVIVLDLNMPGMDGLMTLKEIRKIDANVPVIVLSGHLNIALSRDVMRLGAAEFLQKPCSIEDLTFAIETAFERKTIHTEIRYKIKKSEPRA
jgi:DNA-binding NtrC family response regulator